MSTDKLPRSIRELRSWILKQLERGTVPLVIGLAGMIGVLGGCGAVVFTLLIETVSRFSVEQLLPFVDTHGPARILLCLVPAIGLLSVSWLTRRFAPEAQGHGVPEVITAVARNDGIIRPRVSLVKILASGICIGTGGSIGREGPIVQIGASIGSVLGQRFGLSARNIKVLVAAGAAAGISATFHAPLSGVVFASEIILGSFAVQSMTPVVVAAVLADVVQTHYGEHRDHSAFTQLDFTFAGEWSQLPLYVVLGLVCGLAAVSFTKILYKIEDLSGAWLKRWWLRAIICGTIVGVAGVMYPTHPPVLSQAVQADIKNEVHTLPPLFGVGYGVVDHVLHLENESKSDGEGNDSIAPDHDKTVSIVAQDMWKEFWWLLPLALLKPLLTSITLAGGGSGGIFAPSLFLGATLGGAFGILCNIFVPSISASPGVYAIVGMGAVVAGTTHAVLSAILIVYEMTGDYRIILPIMGAAGLASVVSSLIDPESIYYKKLSRRGETIARGHDMHRLEDVMVRNVMIRNFPTLRHTDNLTEIVRIARANSHIECLPVMDDSGKMIGIISAEDLHRMLDSDLAPHLVNAEDIAMALPVAVNSDANLLEALREFGSRDVETLPVESGKGTSRKLVGILQRNDVMRRYREELLRRD